ncbi:MAG: transposase domain-containing protein [Lachnospiraceae bacterium]|nr:transposase domain-containing protein [Lachnospiraceae bacterium]
MAKAYDLDLYKYLNFLFEQRPDKEMSDDKLENLAPWNE